MVSAVDVGCRSRRRASPSSTTARSSSTAASVGACIGASPSRRSGQGPPATPKPSLKRPAAIRVPSLGAPSTEKLRRRADGCRVELARFERLQDTPRMYRWADRGVGLDRDARGGRNWSRSTSAAPLDCAISRRGCPRTRSTKRCGTMWNGRRSHPRRAPCSTFGQLNVSTLLDRQFPLFYTSQVDPPFARRASCHGIDFSAGKRRGPMVWNTSRTDSHQPSPRAFRRTRGKWRLIHRRTSPDPRAQAHSRASC